LGAAGFSADSEVLSVITSLNNVRESLHSRTESGGGANLSGSTSGKVVVPILAKSSSRSGLGVVHQHRSCSRTISTAVRLRHRLDMSRRVRPIWPDVLTSSPRRRLPGIAKVQGRVKRGALRPPAPAVCIPAFMRPHCYILAVLIHHAGRCCRAHLAARTTLSATETSALVADAYPLQCSLDALLPSAHPSARSARGALAFHTGAVIMSIGFRHADSLKADPVVPHRFPFVVQVPRTRSE